jgi:hypothetical protein
MSSVAPACKDGARRRVDAGSALLHTHLRMEDEGPGFKFWASLFGVVIVGAIVALIVLLLLTRAVYAWGVFGVLIFVSLLLLGVAWIYDRRQVKRYEAEVD